MAERRMFAKSIVLSDTFLEMSMSARSLYVTLSMNADDDGFVSSPKGIIRQCNANAEDMSELEKNNFIISFDSGVIVIRHWHVNNTIQNDRKKLTQYATEFSMLDLETNKAYYLRDDVCIQNVSKMDTEYNKDNITNTRYVNKRKDSLGKESLREGELQKGENIERGKPYCAKEGEFLKLGIYGNVELTIDQLNEFKANYPENHDQIIDKYSNIVRADPKAAKNIYAKLNAYASDQNK